MGTARAEGANDFRYRSTHSKAFLGFRLFFQKMVLQECPDSVDFLDAARKYLAALSQVHQHSRNQIEPQVSRARETIADMIERCTEHDANVLALTAYNDSRDSTENVPVFLDWDNVRRKLVARNVEHPKLARRVISSKLDWPFGNGDS